MSISMTQILLLVLLSITKGVFCNEPFDAIEMARTQLMNARTWFQRKTVQYTGLPSIQLNAALNDCDKLYDEADYRLNNVLAGADHDDARAWVSAALTNHRTCLDGLAQKGFPNPPQAQNLTTLLSDSLAIFSTYGHKNDKGQKQQNQKAQQLKGGEGQKQKERKLEQIAMEKMLNPRVSTAIWETLRVPPVKINILKI
ncbi:Pectinesterase inhibitor domain [Dillenia turbinata]|uniref:Pectinesterase inhibitor domain n=1 Tax=Dillenia turbinata TaxID=194707 RepID=A0AAN8UN19_9MAGN